MEVQNKREYLEKAKEMICLMLVLAGIFLCMSDFIKLKVHPVSLFFYITGIVLLLLLLEKKRTWRKYILLALTVLVFLVIEGSLEELKQGYFGCMNQVITMLNQYYRMELIKIPWEENPQMQDYFFRFFLIGTGCVEGGIWYFTRKKKGFCFRLLLPAALLTGIMLTGVIPSFAGIVLLVTGALAGKLNVEQRGGLGALGGMLLVLSAATVFAHSQKAETFLKEMHDPWQEKQWEAEEAAWNYMQRHLAQEGVRKEEIQLGNQKPQRNGRVVFEITLSECPEESVYLKGFIGGIYENGSWQAVAEETFENFAENAGYEAADYAGWVAEQSYEWAEWAKEEEEKREIIYQVYMIDDGTESEKKVEKRKQNSQEIKIKMAEMPAGYILVPYYSKQTEQLPVRDDGTVLPKQQEYRWESYLYVGNYSGMERSTDWDERWESYQQYVNENYTMVPDGLDQLSGFTKEYAEYIYDHKTAVRSIPSLLAGQAEYSLDLEPLPEGGEFIEDFLFRQKKGYCVHFATAGTLMLRMYGIPARYVSGYCIPSEDFKENPDGTYTASVTDERAHAWSEIFEMGRGFYPVEMTPAAEEIPDQEPVQENQKEPEKEEIPESEQEGVEQKEPEKEVVPETIGQAGEMEQPGIAGAVFRKAAGILLLLLLAAGGMTAYRRRVLKRRQKGFQQENRNEAVLEIGKEVFRLLEISGYRREKNISDQAYAIMLQEKIPVAEAVNWQQFVDILQKAAFSEQILSEEEWQKVWNLYHLFRELLETRQNTWQRLWWKYIRICS